jgi:hypothetical protein
MNAPRRLLRLALAALLPAALGACASSGMLRAPPDWVAELRSQQNECTAAAAEAKARAIAVGVAPERMQWLYGRKPFADVGHVSLVIDGWIVVDNGGLGRDLWGGSICAYDVCTLDEARRGYDESFLEPATLALRTEFGRGEWGGRIAAVSAAP